MKILNGKRIFIGKLINSYTTKKIFIIVISEDRYNIARKPYIVSKGTF